MFRTLCVALAVFSLCPPALASVSPPPLAPAPAAAPPAPPAPPSPPFQLPVWQPPPIQFSVVGGSATAQLKCKHEGQEWKRCRAPCPVTCTNMRPTAKDECNRLECQDEGFCLCAGDRPVWDEEKKRCASLSECPNVPVERLVSPRRPKTFINRTEGASQSSSSEKLAASAAAEAPNSTGEAPKPIESESTSVECPELLCNAKNIPWRCPPGSKVDNPKDRNGCLGCKTCVDEALRPVKVPYCWTIHSVCPPSRCPQDQLPRLMFRASTDGEKPCCHDFECFSKADDAPSSHSRHVSSIGTIAAATTRRVSGESKQATPNNQETKPASQDAPVQVPLSERSLDDGLTTSIRRAPEPSPSESTGLYSGAARLIHRLQARTLELADPLMKLREKELYLLTGSSRGVANPRHWSDEEL